MGKDHTLFALVDGKVYIRTDEALYAFGVID